MLDWIPRWSACMCPVGLGIALVAASAGLAQEGAQAVNPPSDPVPLAANPSYSPSRQFPFLGFFNPRPEDMLLEGREEEGEPDEIQTDRDSFTPATKLVGRDRFIVESAYSYIENRHTAATHSFPELLIRYGLTDRLELRLGCNYEVGGAGNNVSGTDAGAESLVGGSKLERESTINYGLKFLVNRPDGWVPRSSVILQGSTPTSGNATDSQFVAFYVFGWDLPNRWVFDAALRYATASAEEDHFNNWAPSAVLKVPVGEKWNVHAEYFGIFSSGKEQESVQHYASTGVHYLINPNVEIGLRLGWGLNEQSARFFSNVGVGWRF